MSRPKRSSARKTAADDVYATLRTLFGLNGHDDRVVAFLAKYRAKPPDLESGSGFANVDLRSIGVRLLFWVGWGDSPLPSKYAVEPGSLVETAFFQEGIDRHKRFGGALPRDLHVDMTREDLERSLGAPTSACTCGQEPTCFVSWHVRDFDGPLVADITHHAKHAGRTKPRVGRVDISVHLPRAK